MGFPARNGIKPHISVIIATCHPKWLANCLRQVADQQVGGLRVETIVVAEGKESRYRCVLRHRRPSVVIHKEVEGRWGAFAKDRGLGAAAGDYVVFWDDDNIYYPHALATLYAAACGADVGIARTAHMGLEYQDIPRDHVIESGNVDTMCFCVRREVATRARWSDHAEKGTDHAYLCRLLALCPDLAIRFVDVRIGEKLEGPS